MKKVFRLIFGDTRNVASVVVAVALAWGVAHEWPAASGAVLAAALVAAAVWQSL